MRRWLAAVLMAALPVGAVAAPFQHVHPDVYDTDHHAGRAAHAHVAPHQHHDDHDETAGPALSEADHDRALPVQLMVAVAAAAPHVAPALPPHVVLPVPPERPAHVAVAVVHGHDPPVRSLRAPRPPPVPLS